MKQIFRTYNSLNASIFDLLSGKTEVKQTTGLAFLLSNDKNVLQGFLNIGEIQRLIGKTKIQHYNKIIVHSELFSKNRRRADVVIQLYKNNQPEFALIIEAKNAKIKSSSKSVVKQITEYLQPDEFIDLKDFKLFGCALTKNDLIMHNPQITAVSWSTIFEMLNKKGGLAKDYLEYISRIKGTMKFYEKEVFSIPAGDSYKYQYSYPFIYECPNEGTQYTSMKKPLFMAFRKKMGIMERIFGVEEIIIMNPKTDFNSFLNNKEYSNELKKRMTDYCNEYWGEDNYDDSEKQFFILSQTNQIELKHKPRPPKNNAFRAYYKLSELLDENKKTVNTDKN